jgi:hypothetical protein
MVNFQNAVLFTVRGELVGPYELPFDRLRANGDSIIQHFFFVLKITRKNS